MFLTPQFVQLLLLVLVHWSFIEHIAYVRRQRGFEHTSFKYWCYIFTPKLGATLSLINLICINATRQSPQRCKSYKLIDSLSACAVICGYFCCIKSHHTVLTYIGIETNTVNPNSCRAHVNSQCLVSYTDVSYEAVRRVYNQCGAQIVPMITGSYAEWRLS